MSNINDIQKTQLKVTEKLKLFGICDLDIDLIKLVLMSDLNIMLIYFHAYIYGLNRYSDSKAMAQKQ